MTHRSIRRCLRAQGGDHLLCGQNTNTTSRSRSTRTNCSLLFFDMCSPSRASSQLATDDGPTASTITTCMQNRRLFRLFDCPATHRFEVQCCIIGGGNCGTPRVVPPGIVSCWTGVIHGPREKLDTLSHPFGSYRSLGFLLATLALKCNNKTNTKRAHSSPLST